MSLLLRCQWMPPPQASLEGRIAELANFLSKDRLLTAIAPRWFKLGRSPKDALKHEVRLDELKIANCRRVPLIDNQSYLALDLWNGRPEEQGANLHSRLYDPPDQVDVVSITFERGAVGKDLGWEGILNSARCLSQALGGYVILRSDQLLGEAEERGIPNAEFVACAAFWGDDRSGRNPLYSPAVNSTGGSFSEIIACHSWSEVEAPDSEQLAFIANRLMEAVTKGGK